MNAMLETVICLGLLASIAAVTGRQFAHSERLLTRAYRGWSGSYAGRAADWSGCGAPPGGPADAVLRCRRHDERPPAVAVLSRGRPWSDR